MIAILFMDVPHDILVGLVDYLYHEINLVIGKVLGRERKYSTKRFEGIVEFNETLIFSESDPYYIHGNYAVGDFHGNNFTLSFNFIGGFYISPDDYDFSTYEDVEKVTKNLTLIANYGLENIENEIKRRFKHGINVEDIYTLYVKRLSVNFGSPDLIKEDDSILTTLKTDQGDIEIWNIWEGATVLQVKFLLDIVDKV